MLFTVHLEKSKVKQDVVKLVSKKRRKKKDRHLTITLINTKPQGIYSILAEKPHFWYYFWLE